MNQQFAASQFIPLPREAVFSFFATPRNLEAITPGWLRFRIDSRSADRPGVGVEYTYRLLIRGLPFKWKSRITEWVPGERFVDVQLSGPYARWHHTHTFEDAPGGTLVRDHVSYRLPFGALGRILAGRMVQADVRRIFAHRKRRTDELLCGETAGESSGCRPANPTTASRV